MSTIQWAETFRLLSKAESSIAGKFDCSRTPAFEYIYLVCDNWFIHIVGMMKSSQVGASELENNIIGKVQDTMPCNSVIFFPGTNLLKEFSRKRLVPFFASCSNLRKKCNIGIPKPAHDYFTFLGGGSISLRTIGSIQSVLSSPLPFIILEEFAQVKAEVAKQGDPLELVIGRQKSFIVGMKKVLGFSTPTFKDFCPMEKLYNNGNKLVFKAHCNHCGSLVEVSGWTMDSIVKYHEYPDMHIDPKYGKYDPESAYFQCPSCEGEWSFEQKTTNIVNGKKFGFVDDCGDFSLGWHKMGSTPEDVITIEQYRELEPTINKLALRKKLKDEKVSLTYSFQYPELLSCFAATSNATVLATKKILADKALEDKGEDTLLKDYFNNNKGLPFVSGITALERDDLIALRSNYPEGTIPMPGLVLTMGVDVQDNRFAFVIRAWGRNQNSYLVKWAEIFGDTRQQDWDDLTLHFSGVWGDLQDIIAANHPHAAEGKYLHIAACSIDSGHLAELVYNFCIKLNLYCGLNVMATKGTRDLRYSEDEIYSLPEAAIKTTTEKNMKSLAETMGTTVFHLGAHRAHEEILRRIALNKNKDAKSYIYFFNQQSYPNYEDQMTSCRKIIDTDSSYTKPVFKLIAGRRKEAMDAEKNALHAGRSLGLHNYTNDNWRAIEQYLYN